jgi:hypothetical protein
MLSVCVGAWSTNQRDGDIRSIGEDERDFFELASPAPVLREEYPMLVSVSVSMVLSASYQPAPLSPNPCATITLAVCRLSAGTTRGAL